MSVRALHNQLEGGDRVSMKLPKGRAGAHWLVRRLLLEAAERAMAEVAHYDSLKLALRVMRLSGGAGGEEYRSARAWLDEHESWMRKALDIEARVLTRRRNRKRK